MTSSKKKRVQAVRKWLQRFPAIRQQLPLIQSTFQRIPGLADDCGEYPSIVREALHQWIFANPHQRAILEPGAWRYTLEGEPIEPVSEEERARAIQHIEKRRQMFAERAARIEPATPKPTPATPAKRSATVTATVAKTPAKPTAKIATPVVTAASMGKPVLKLKRKEIVQ